jgi:hypothetical protein
MSWIGTTEPHRADAEATSQTEFAACVVLGAALASPCLSTGWVADDLWQQLALGPSAAVAGVGQHAWDLFRFANGDPQSARQLMDAGVFPWWADPHARLAFFRPLTCFTHWLDYQLWPTSAVAMHVQSLLWFGALLAVVGAVYRRFFEGRRAAHLALLLFAIDDAHAPAVGWLANRNVLIALCLSLPALLFHDDFRRTRSPRSAWLGALALALGLCAGEAALVACAYLAAYAVFLDRGSFRSRCGSLWRYAAVVLAWRVLLGWLGYGVSGSGLYVDPVASPLAFARVAIERLPVLLLAQLALPWSDFWELYPLTAPALRVATLGLALLVVAAFVSLLRPLWQRAEVRFWALGGALALMPMCATFPHDRLLLGAGVGAMALVAELLGRALRLRQWPVLVALGGIHLALAPILLPLRAAHVADLNRALNAADDSIPSDPQVTRKSVVLLNPPLDPFAAYLPIYREAAGRSRPRALLWLATGVSELTVTGVDSHTIRLRARDGFLSSASQLMLRDPRRPPRLGETVELGAASIRVRTSMPDGRPREVEVRLRQPLLSDELVWMQWGGRGYAPFRLPESGESVVVPAVDIASALFG